MSNGAGGNPPKETHLPRFLVPTLKSMGILGAAHYVSLPLGRLPAFALADTVDKSSFHLRGIKLE